MVGRWNSVSQSRRQLRMHWLNGGNFSVRTGIAPNNLVVFDLDLSVRADGVESLRQFLTKDKVSDMDHFSDAAHLASLLEAPCVKSPHGYHLYFTARALTWTFFRAA